MILVQINISCGSGSTGKICEGISRAATACGIENYVLYNSGSSNLGNAIKYTDRKQVKRAALLSRIQGNWGFEGNRATRSLLAWLDKLKPDVIHLHNLHSHACNLEMLFEWIKKHGVKVFWTFHDCWNFTGYCMNYDMIGCQKWQSGCGGCPQKKSFSWFFDRSADNYKRKLACTRDVDLTVVAPSRWTASQVKQSFMRNYPVKVIYNGLNLSVFKPVKGNFRESLSIGERPLVLGVASGWGEKKGLDVFFALSKRLGDAYRMVLVGLKEVPAAYASNILAVPETRDQQFLAQIYTAADVFVNPTREEALGMTNLEALACGTPVVTFRTGGSPETLDSTCGVAVDKNDIDSMEAAIRRICETAPFSAQACRKRAMLFDGEVRFQEYVKLYTGR